MWAPGRGTRSIVLLLLLAPIPRATAGEPAPADPGRDVYQKKCLECHGKTGRGDGPSAVKLHFHPRDFTHASFKCRCTATGELPTDADLARTVTDGLAGTPMLGFGAELSPAEVQAVVSYVKTLSGHFDKQAAPACVEVPDPPPAAEDQTTAGEQVYRLLQCWRCHGKTGLGDGPSAGEMHDDWGRPVKPRRFSSDGKLMCGSSDRDLYRLLHTGMNGSPMASFDDAFLFPRQGADALGAVKAQFGEAETARLAAWLEGQPDAGAIQAMPAVARQALVGERTWALVRYLRSLTGGKAAPPAAGK